MANIPRRKIYETLLEYEELLLIFNFVIHNEKNFKENNESKGSLKKIKFRYDMLKILILMFFENETYRDEEEFDAKIDYYVKNISEVDQYLKKQKNLTNHFKELILKLDSKFNNGEYVKEINEGIDLFSQLDDFNKQISKILELRRDQIKK